MLYVKFVCVKLMYVKFVCVKLLYVKFIVVYVRRREEEKEPGIQNQKQEPHTKMWGKTMGILSSQKRYSYGTTSH